MKDRSLGQELIEADNGFMEKQSNEVNDESYFEKSKEEDSLEINGTVTVITRQASPENLDRKISAIDKQRNPNKLGLI